MSNKLSDFQPPLIIDIGSDKVKFCQPSMSTFAISNIIKKNIIKSSQSQLLQSTPSPRIPIPITNTPDELNPEQNKLNSNSVFEYNLFMDSFPSILGTLDSETELAYFNNLRRLFNANDYQAIFKLPIFEQYKNSKINFSYDFQNSKYDYRCNTFGYEIMWGGIIDDKIAEWKNIINRIGQTKFQEFNFLNNLYSETPIILTQHALPFNTLKTQVKQMYEILFEEYKTPAMLLCSQAMLNLYSQNLTSGIVVDMGESSTSITSVLDGFTQYDNSITSNFLSGRNLNLILAAYLKSNQNTNINQNFNLKEEIKNENIGKLFEISMNDYLEAKFIKENKEIFSCYDNNNNNSDSNNLNESRENIYSNAYFGKINKKDISTFNYLYSFPEVYKWLFSSKNYQDLYDVQSFTKNINSTINFILDYKGKRFNDREKLGFLSYVNFEKINILPYINQNFDSIEKEVLLRPTNFILDDQLVKFRQLSLTHLLVSNLEKIISQDILNASKFVNVVLAGGVLNTTNFSNVISNDLLSLLFSNDSIKLNVMNNIDNSESFYKGANYLSKIDDLENIMVSKQDYYDYGADYLCYNYI